MPATPAQYRCSTFSHGPRFSVSVFLFVSPKCQADGTIGARCIITLNVFGDTWVRRGLFGLGGEQTNPSRQKTTVRLYSRKSRPIYYFPSERRHIFETGPTAQRQRKSHLKQYSTTNVKFESLTGPLRPSRMQKSSSEVSQGVLFDYQI